MKVRTYAEARVINSGFCRLATKDFEVFRRTLFASYSSATKSPAAFYPIERLENPAPFADKEFALSSAAQLEIVTQ
ncbi:MAG TPA: hypothetical protein VIS53_03890 [Candidatus Udaeobacter sp.]|jgi:hypothetical protein